MSQPGAPGFGLLPAPQRRRIPPLGFVPAAAGLGAIMYHRYRRKKAQKRGKRRRTATRASSQRDMMFRLYRPIVSIFKPTFKTQLTYIVKTAMTGNPRDTEDFKGNDIYDISGGTEQPLYFDQLTAIYKLWRVDASYINVQVCNTGSEGCTIVVLPHLHNTGLTSLEMAASQSKAKNVMMGSDNAVDTVTMTHFAKTSELYPLESIKAHDFIGDEASDPALVWYWRVHAENNVVAALDLHLVIKIIYFVTFGGLFVQAVS